MINRHCLFVFLLALFGLFSITSCVSNSVKPNSSEKIASDESSEQAFNSLVAKGDDALSRGAYSDAQVQYALAIKEQPENIELLYKLSIVHYEKKSFDVATELLKAIIDKDASHIGAYEILGLIALKKENIEVAEYNLSKALGLDGNRWRSRNAMGIVKDMQSMHTEAQLHFQQALYISPNKAQAENNLGYSHYLSGSYYKAEQHFRNATQLDPNYEKAWANLGLVFIRKNQYQDARYAFSKVVDDHVASNNLGYLSMLQGDDVRARQELDRAILLSPTYYPKASANLVSLNTRNESSDYSAPREFNNSSSPRGKMNKTATIDSLAKPNTNAATIALPAQAIKVIHRNDTAEVRTNQAITESTNSAPIVVTPTVTSNAKRITKEKPKGTQISRHYLKILGYRIGDGPNDSLYNPLLSFQATHQLEPTGKLDRASLELLTAEAIQRVKLLLISLNYKANTDSSAVDAKTVNSLKRFQSNNSLPISGKIDKDTLLALTRYLDGGVVALNQQ